MSAREIIEGWRNHLIPPKDLKEVIKKVSEERLEICSTCPKQSENAKADGYKTIRIDLHCTACGCPLASKTKSLSSKCPLGKWEAITTDEERFEIERQINEENKLQGGDDSNSEGAI